MDPATAAAIAGASVSAVGSLGSTAGSFIRGDISNKELAARQRHWDREDATTAFERQKELDTIAYDRSVDMTRRVQELEKAGLSRYLIEGSIPGVSTSGSTAPQAASGSMPYGGQHQSMMDAISSINTTLDASMKIAQIKNLESQTHKNEANTPSPDMATNMFAARLENIAADTSNKKASAALSSIRTSAECYDLSFKQSLESTNREAAIAAANNTILQGSKLSSEIDNLIKTGKYTDTQIRALEGEIGLISLRETLLKSDINNKDADTRLTIAQAKQVEKFYENVYSDSEYLISLKESAQYRALSDKSRAALDEFEATVRSFTSPDKEARRRAHKEATSGSMVSAVIGAVEELGADFVDRVEHEGSFSGW